jgi:porphobilinogen synthase
MGPGFPIQRLRRLRMTPTLRSMVKETELHVTDLIYPLFVVHGSRVKTEVPSMPGVYNMSVDHIVEEAAAARDLGIPAVLLFGIPKTKDDIASEAYDPQGIVQQAVRAIKKSAPDLVVITDVCLCEYTANGHCGIVRDGKILNDPTLEVLARVALSHAEAGADIVAPSDMMDGRVKAIRKKLDEKGFPDTAIMSYAAKYASAFYGPFRDAARSAPAFGDRRSHQMDIANAREAELEILLDIEEGADIVMVKPALAYLDIIYRIRQRVLQPVAAYSVSGEYALIKAAAQQGWLDEEHTVVEWLTAIKRAGADLILTYFAKAVALKIAK